jgi:hypothetical protein
VVFTFTA